MGTISAIVTTYGLVTGTLSFTDPGATPDQVQTIVEGQTASVLTGMNRALKDAITAEHGLDCAAIEHDWENPGNGTKADKQSFVLVDGVVVGSIRYPHTFNDTFLLQMRFVPRLLGGDGAGLTISVKDDLDNELSITIGEADSLGYDSYRYTYKRFDHQPITGKGSILPLAENRIALLQLETMEQASGLAVVAFMKYPRKGQADSDDVRADVLKGLGVIDSFSSGVVSLNMGLQKGAKGSPRVEITDCRITNKP